MSDATPIILDTDMHTDCDDTGALAVLHALADRGEARPLGVVCDAPSEWSAPCAAAINAYYGRPELPVGALRHFDLEHDPRYARYRAALQRTNPKHLYGQVVAKRFPCRIARADDAEDGVALYRRLLAAEPDGSVVIAAVGMLTLLEGLLASGPDTHSPDDGMTLARRKVRRLVTMAKGTFPNGADSWNWRMDARAAAAVLTHWPGPLVVQHLGTDVKTGPHLVRRTPTSNPVRLAYECWFAVRGAQVRPSWDQLTVLYAVRGCGDAFIEHRGHRVEFDPQTIEHTWVPDPASRHSHLELALPAQRMTRPIEALMCLRPA